MYEHTIRLLIHGQRLIYLGTILLFCLGAYATDADSTLDHYNVCWTNPGPSSAESMPVGNGDIGLNVWVETNGDLYFYIGKTDAWGNEVRADQNALMKLGGVRLSLNPNPLDKSTVFRQELRLRTGDILIQEGTASIDIWVDANHPVIQVEVNDSTPFTATTTLDNWRPRGDEDVICPEQTNQIIWYHRNWATADQHVANVTFGAIARGTDMINQDEITLKSRHPASHQLVSIYPLTATTPSVNQWLDRALEQATQLDHLNSKTAREDHDRWWDQFWHRSWIFVQGDELADKVTRGYILQRFITACGGRGAFPIKFNGSIFVVDNPALPQGQGRPPRAVNADFRTWGGQYWFQNTRAMYWPRLKAGDFDLMQPLFRMYADQLAGNSNLVAQYYHHGGAYFAETAPYWGGLRYWGPEVKENWTGHYFTPILEISMMTLDYYQYTGDERFARETMLPIAEAGITFFDQHFKRDTTGKILLDPDNAIETYWKVHDPAPDIAGLHAVLPRLIALPDDLVSDSLRTNWERMLNELPPLPRGVRNGLPALLPYTGEQTAKMRNGENPELYAVYPFRLFGLGKPELKLAVDTFNTRICRQKGCWVQDPVQAAMLGLTKIAADYVSYDLTRSDPRLKFPAFWVGGNDYAPDEDNGGNGENGLQEMIMQCDDRKIMLKPAWPKKWNAYFRLNAPFQTTVQGKIENGKIEDLVVEPIDRQKDVILYDQ